MESVVEMISTLFFGIFEAMLPLVLASALMYYYAVRTGLLPSVRSPKELEIALKQVRKDYQAEKKGKKRRRQSDDMIWYDDKPQHPNYVLKKWLSFGGGFYGLTALVTYAVIEYAEIVDFFANFTSIADFINRIGIGMLIDFIIESIINFVLSLAWPLYWMTELPKDSVFIIYLIEAYIGYRIGRILAFVALRRMEETGDVWGNGDLVKDAIKHARQPKPKQSEEDLPASD